MGVTEVLVSAGLGVVASAATAYATARFAARKQLRQLRTELTNKYANS